MGDDEQVRIRNKEIGFIFQTFNLLLRETALHSVELLMIYAGVAPEARHTSSASGVGRSRETN